MLCVLLLFTRFLSPLENWASLLLNGQLLYIHKMFPTCLNYRAKEYLCRVKMLWENNYRLTFLHDRSKMCFHSNFFPYQKNDPGLGIRFLILCLQDCGTNVAIFTLLLYIGCGLFLWTPLVSHNCRKIVLLYAFLLCRSQCGSPFDVQRIYASSQPKFEDSQYNLKCEKLYRLLLLYLS